MASLSFLPIGRAGRLVFRPIYPQVVVAADYRTWGRDLRKTDDEEEILEMILAFLTIQAHRRTGTDPVSPLLLSGVGAGPEVTTEKT